VQNEGFDPKSLQGHTILLPEARQLLGLETVIVGLGATVHRFRVGDGRGGSRTVERWLAELVEGEFDDVLFATAQGVHLLCEFAAGQGRDAELAAALRGVRVIALGTRPARALANLGINVAVKASTRSTDGLLDLLPDLGLDNHVVGMQHWGPELDPRIAEYLESIGAEARLVSNAPVGDPRAEELLSRLASPGRVSIVFTGVSQVTWLFDAAAAAGRTEQLVQALGRVRVIAAESVADVLRARSVSVIPVAMRTLVVLPNASEAAVIFDGSRAPTPPRTAETGAALPAVASISSGERRRRVVVIGNGMVGYRFCDRLHEIDKGNRFSVTVLSEENRPAYDRVQLTKYFSTRNAEDLQLASASWYAERNIDLRLGQRALRIDRRRRVIVASEGGDIPYDHCVIATGSSPFVPPVPGTDKNGVFVYRTIEDLEAIIDYSRRCRRVAVMGGGLLGLEAARAVAELGLETHVVEFAPRLMPRQLDNAGASLLARKIRALGVHVHLSKNTARIMGEDTVVGLRYTDGERLDVDMVVISAGIRPRDDVAREAGLRVGERGGIMVDDRLRTSDSDIFAIGECALHRGSVYGLVAPGYEMADAVAMQLTGSGKDFAGADTSTKLKLMGVDVASFGDSLTQSDRSIVYEDLVKGVYKKLILSDDGRRLLGGSLVGDATEFAELVHLMKSGEEPPASPETLILGARGAEEFGKRELPDAMQVCSCNNVTKGAICQVMRDGKVTLAEVKSCTRAGTGCGGCMPLVTDLFNKELQKLGHSTKPVLCEHFAFTRQELYHIVKVRKLKSFEAVLKDSGQGNGCEVCKPAIASILASTVNELIVRHDHLQDTNDRFLANIQRQGLYSIVPRVPGGEITPEKLIVLGQVAQKYNLYTKITGGQRIDLFGARVNQLPEIWEELVAAGFESGHAYGKALRTVKSCVGTSWCRYGVQDSVGFAIRVENRYKGIRAPHKLKSAVSGCTRECAEAQSKDFGLIATEKGWNVYVCGNGGMKPRHGDLLVSDVSDDDAIRYLDRFIMYYISTADKLTRTSVWLDKLKGGIEQLKKVVIDDSLGICAELESDMAHLVETYHCEWAEVVRDPELRARFNHFANSPESDEAVKLVPEREMLRPANWVKGSAPERERRHLPVVRTSWRVVGDVSDFPHDLGRTIRYGRAQIAVFNFESRGEWYAVQNECPHKRDMVLSRGIIGDQNGTPKVACPMHKRTFSLVDGHCMTGEDYCLTTFPVRVEQGKVLLELPEEKEVERILFADEVREGEEQTQTAAE
jgi:nitrite reductase (NADH) large subunit